MPEQDDFVEDYRAEWLAWFSMISRCHWPGDKAYKSYGARGIYVCERWRKLDGFANFIHDIGRRPSKELSLDRTDNNQGYSPENCRWATRTEQARNTRSNRLLTIDGETAPVAAWAEKSGVSRKIITDRLEYGWEPSEAVFTPRRPNDDISPGTKFFAWTVLKRSGKQARASGGKALYDCQCSCGDVHTITGYDLRHGNTHSCRSCRMLGNTYAAKTLNPLDQIDAIIGQP